AMFIMLVGILGVLAALPTGVTSAEWVIFQDAAIQLSQSKFSEFRRDRVSPLNDLAEGSAYMAACQEPVNGSPAGPWHHFAHASGQAYEYFDDIERYEWRVDQDALAKPLGNSAPIAGLPAPYLAPLHQAGTAPIGLGHVTVIVKVKNLKRELRFTQYLLGY